MLLRWGAFERKLLIRYVTGSLDEVYHTCPTSFPAVASDTDNGSPIHSSGSILTFYSPSLRSYACHNLSLSIPCPFDIPNPSRIHTTRHNVLPPRRRGHVPSSANLRWQPDCHACKARLRSKRFFPARPQTNTFTSASIGKDMARESKVVSAHQPIG